MDKKKKLPRARRAADVRPKGGGAVAQSSAEFIDPPVAVFYRSGTSIGGADPVHVTPWATLEAALAACMDYIGVLNAWWDAQFPGDLYADESCVLVDVVHLDGSGQSFRVGILPNAADHPPPPPAGAVQIPYGDGTAWADPNNL